MKNTLIHKSILVSMVLFFTLSCENTELDLQTSPNDPPNVELADIESVYNAIQLSLAGIQFTLEDQTGEVTRMYAATAGSTYEAETLPTVFDGLWDNVYAGFLPDVDLLDRLLVGRSSNLAIHRGAPKIMKAYIIMAMVDVFGDIPYSEVGQGLANLNPNVDNGRALYDTAEMLLNSAIAIMQVIDQEDVVKPGYDNYYGGSVEKWIKLANTLKLRSALYLDDRSGFDAIIDGNEYIKDAKEDFQVNYGSQRANPNSRHPRYNNVYEINDGDYMSNYYMWLMAEDKTIPNADPDGDPLPQIDPRIRYYFFRKVSNSDRQDEDVYSCSLSDLPDQTQKPSDWGQVDSRFLYCYASTKGYIGRDHLNNAGIPPDGTIRTAYGLYPAGGDFDANDFKKTQNRGVDGGLGEGIIPIMLSSYVDFMRAEMAMRAGDEADAKKHLLNGVEKSLEKVRSFESLVSAKMNTTRNIFGQKKTIRELYGMKDADIKAYKTLVGDRFDNAATSNPSAVSKLDVIIKEYYLAAYGNGLEAYNMYRRTGLPNNMQPALRPSGVGKFPRSFRYANAFVDRNGTVDQKEESDKIFWDGGSTVLR